MDLFTPQKAGSTDPAKGNVEIQAHGRSGTIVYSEPAGSLSFFWEFGGGDVVVTIMVGTATDWAKQYPWAVERRSGILRRIADEVIRQKAPGCCAETDDVGGFINIVEGTRRITPPQPAPRAFSYTKWRSFRVKLALGVLAVALIFGAVVWFKNKVLVIDPGKGAPIGLAVRTDRHIAMLIQTLEPYTPTLHRDGSKDRYTISLFLLPLDGRSEGRTIGLVDHLGGHEFSLAKILGSDGRTLWFDVTGVGGVDLETFDVIGTNDFRKANPTLDPTWWEDGRGMEVSDRLRSTARDQQSAVEFDPSTLKATPVAVVRDPKRSPFAPRKEDYLCAGAFVTPTRWLGLHSLPEAEREFKPKSRLKRIVPATDAKEQRLFYHGTLDPDSSDVHHRILSMEALGDAEYLNAAFIRLDGASEPLRLASPDGFLVLFTSKPGLAGTAVVARVDDQGTIIWKTDTGIDRFLLQQILPGKRSIALIGARPAVPDKVSEPLLVVVDNGTGKAGTTSLWQ